MTLVANNFNRAAETYDKHANWQYQAALDCASFIKKHLSQKNITSILDIGTGTGFLAKTLSSNFPVAKVFLNDIAANMLKIAQTKIHSANILLGDGLDSARKLQHTDLICTSMCLQWQETNCTNYLLQLIPHCNILAGSILTAGSLYNWRKLHLQYGLQPPTISLPSTSDILHFFNLLDNYQIFCQTKTYYQSFNKIQDLIQNLRQVGANTQNANYNKISLKTLLQNPKTIDINYETLHFVIISRTVLTKPFNV